MSRVQSDDSIPQCKVGIDVQERVVEPAPRDGALSTGTMTTAIVDEEMVAIS
jgi:hypothetical protein